MIAPISLGTWPTPAEPAPRLAAHLGLDALWFKRDDLGGLGGGGNKVRKLQYTCAQALAAGATTLITTGAAQSNHARLTAAAAARLGLRCVLVLAGAPEDRPGGNLILNALAGAEVVWAGDRPTAEVVEERRGDAFVIPFGGSSPESVPAYADCARETEGVFLDPTYTGRAMAGLIRGRYGPRIVFLHTGGLPGLFSPPPPESPEPPATGAGAASGRR